MDRDRSGNPLALRLQSARGRILASNEDDVTKLQRAGRIGEPENIRCLLLGEVAG